MGRFEMKVLRVHMGRETASYEDLPEVYRLVGGRGLIAKIMNEEVSPDTDPLGENNKLIIAAGPLAGTMAPQLGRISVGAKSPLTLGIKEANAGGPAAQKLDKLGIRAIIIQGIPKDEKLHCLIISKRGAVLAPADEYRGMGNYQMVDELQKKYGRKTAIISVGVAGEKRYKAASVSFTDMNGDPSRNAARGGVGAVMGSKGLKAIIIDDSDTPAIPIADPTQFKKIVKSWVDTIRHDIGCQLFSKLGTPLAVASASKGGTMPGKNYRTGRPDSFMSVSGEVIQRHLAERGGVMHGCMSGCVVRCSIVYPDAEGKKLASSFEYEAIGMLGTNLGIADLDSIARLKFLCDDLGVDLIEIGSCLGVAAQGGKMRMGDLQSAIDLLQEIEHGTDFGRILADGVVSTAAALNINRVPAFKGQAIPAHDPRAVKGIGVTYATSPMGADHTAGLTYRIPLQKTGQIGNSLRFQVQAATCDTLGYCINAIPSGRMSLYEFLAELVNARYGMGLNFTDIVEMGKQTLKDELRFNEGAEFSKIYDLYPAFVRTEALPPTDHVFDVEDSELTSIWEKLDSFKEPQRVWEVRLPSQAPILFGAGTLKKLGKQAERLKIRKALLITDPIMGKLGRTDEVQGILETNGINSVVFSDIVADPPVELVESVSDIFRSQDCNGLIAIGGGSSLDLAKGIALRVSHAGALTDYDSMVGGSAKIRPPIPPLICIPTTSGTGSEANQYAVITDKQRNIKFVIVSDYLIPKLAIIDPNLCASMPPSLTAESGIDALAHCIEGYVGLSIPYNPYYESLAIYGTKLVGRSLVKAYQNGDNISARTDMCMAALYGGIAFTKGLGIGHAIAHVIGAQYHISHGRAVAVSLLCFVRANEKVCQEQFSDLAWALNRLNNLETALIGLYHELELPLRISDLKIPEKDLAGIALETSLDAANLASNPSFVSKAEILKILKDLY
jgi:aldehyde:ferredoxin oxidoreductase